MRDLVEQAYAAVNARDPEAFRPLITPDFVLVTRVEAHHGYEGAVAWLDRVEEAFDGYAIELLDSEEVDGLLLASVRQRGRGPASGVEIDDEFTHLWTFRDGLAARMQSFADRDEALRHIQGGGGASPPLER